MQELLLWVVGTLYIYVNMFLRCLHIRNQNQNRKTCSASIFICSEMHIWPSVCLPTAIKINLSHESSIFMAIKCISWSIQFLVYIKICMLKCICYFESLPNRYCKNGICKITNNVFIPRMHRISTNPYSRTLHLFSST